MASIDLNCDMGEGCDSDAQIIAHVTSVNIACGYHAGDAETMQKTVCLARDHGVAIGAHPSLSDRAHFGRRVMPVTQQEVYDLVLVQANILAAIAREAGAAPTHLKPHGALYNMAAGHAAIATAIAEATHDFDAACILVGLAGSKLIRAGENAGLAVASEAFADRNYESDGSLTPRDQPDALIHDSAAAAERVVRMVLEGKVMSRQGHDILLRADTICIHGDSPGAAKLARAIREGLEREGIEVKSLVSENLLRKNHAS